jgi:hypothetical protein
MYLFFKTFLETLKMNSVVDNGEKACIIVHESLS